MKSRTQKLEQFSSISTSNKSLFQARAYKLDYADFCFHMNIIANYKTMVISERAYNLAPFGRIAGKTKDGDYILETGTTNQYEADYSTRLVNANLEHMDKYQRELSLEAANPGRGLKDY